MKFWFTLVSETKLAMSGESVLLPQSLSFVVFLFLPKEEHVFAALDSHKMKC
jgi:hypothetical protein